MTDLTHAVQFLQTAYTILLALSFGEAFKQVVSDKREPIARERIPSLLAFLFMIFPFFHGMSRYLYSTYLAHAGRLGHFAFNLMFDGIVFMLLSSCFFVMSRSLSPYHWQRFYRALVALLFVDSIWIGVALWRGIHLEPWLKLNGFLAAFLIVVGYSFRREHESAIPPIFCAIATFGTTVLGYIWMRDFYFPG